MAFVSNEQVNTWKDLPLDTKLWQPVIFNRELERVHRSIDAYTTKGEAYTHWWDEGHDFVERFWVEETTLYAFLSEKLRDPGCTLAGIMAPGHILEKFGKEAK